ELFPGLVGKRSRDPGRFANTPDVHLEGEVDIGRARRAGNRRRRAVMWRGGDGNVPLTRQHARGDVEADPARAWQVDFGPGVQVGKVALDLARAFDRIDVGAQLDQVTRNETGSETETPQNLDKQPGGVAARAGAGGKRLFRRLNARLHA